MFLVFQILAFWREIDVAKFPPNFVLSIIGYLMMASERTHHKDVKSEKIFSNMPIHSKDSVLNVQFSTILLLKIAQNGRKFKFQKISNFYIVKNFPVNCFKTKEDE